MLFNSFDFAIFLPLIFILYWFVAQKNLGLQNLLIVLASYTFYGWWDWRFLSLILFSSIVDYLVGLGMNRYESQLKRKILLWTSITVNLGFLGFFKYYNFFVESFASTFSFFGRDINVNTLDIILPVGISFYTFQTLSYSIDIYKKKLEPTKNFITFSAFVSFFPQLVAGPIERATNLLPQFYKKREFDLHLAVDGMRQILWGLFKKIVIADNCAEFANLMFNDPTQYSGSALLIGAVFFAFQIYGDFSGYSDIAIGTSRLFGFNLKRNFRYPYFARDIAEFWRRWHISLSTWFRDYLYIPLGGSKVGTLKKIRNTLIIFVVSGFWHGANWTFIIWGALNALYILPLILRSKNRKHLTEVAEGKMLPSLRELGSILLTFGLTTIAWVFFRAKSVEAAFEYIAGIFKPSFFSLPKGEDFVGTALHPLLLISILFTFILVEWIGRGQEHAMATLGSKWNRTLRFGMYYAIIVAIFWFGGREQQFIYFQF